jgi:thymidylate synthase
LAKDAGLAEGRLIGFLADTHIYVNQLDGIREQLARDPERHPLGRVVTDPFTSIWDWTADDSRIEGYASYPKIEFPVAV